MSTATAVRERPVIFSGPMVKAILDGRKTQTRRVVKLRPGQEIEHGAVFSTTDPFWMIASPYGRKGDRLWVRETFASRLDVDPGEDAEKARHYALYRADGTSLDDPHWHPYRERWTPAIHMPRWASRITLEITGVGVEWLAEISEADARAEGFPDPAGANRGYPDRARYWFRRLWDEINGKRPGCSWAANPRVWVVSFRRVEA